MALVWVLLAILVLGGVAVVAAGRGEGLPPADPDRPDLPLPPDGPLVRSDVDQVRFSVGLRGYRMDEVDDVLDRLALDLEARDERIAGLEREVAAIGATPTPGPGPALPDTAPTAMDDRAEDAMPEDAMPEDATPEDATPEDATPEEVTAEDDDVEVGRTLIVPFQETDTRFRPVDPSDDDPRGPGA